MDRTIKIRNFGSFQGNAYHIGKATIIFVFRFNVSDTWSTPGFRLASVIPSLEKQFLKRIE